MYRQNRNYYRQANSNNQSFRLDCNKKMALTNNMRLVWEQHIYWTRMLLISIAEKLSDEKDVANRLMQNPDDIAKIFADYYPADVTNSISELLTQHLQIGGELITALRDNKTDEAAKLNQQWYNNADKMAIAFNSINPYFTLADMRDMLYKHLELTTNEVNLRLAGKYSEDIKAFDEVEQEALAMADYFTTGIIKQFPQKFSQYTKRI